MHVSARRILFLLAVALVAARASTREPSATYQRAGHEGILLQAASRIGTSTEQIVERLGPDLDGRGEHYSSNGHASDPKAILYENITRLSVGPESSSATGTTGDHGARQSMMIRQLELEEEEVNRLSASSAVSGSDAAYDMDRAGTASIGRRQGETALAECSPSRCSFNVDSVGTLSRAEGKGCADPECQSLVLDQRGIKAIATDAFSGMVNLKILIITNNQLGTILHSHLKDLVALEELYLSYNHLTSISDGTFSGLSSLESLHLMYNAIDTVSAESFAGLSGLKRLKLGYQRPDPSLSSVYSMGGLKNIQDGSLRHMPLLEDLDLGRHGFTQLSNGIFSGGLSNLKFLNLQGSQVVELSTKVLRVEPHAFVELSGLESLDLSFSAVDGEALKPGLFRCCTKLNNLDLSGNPITTLTGSAFAGLGNGLEKLNLIICLLSSLSPRTFRGLSKLKTLYLMNNRLSVMPLEVFANLSETCTVGVSGNSLSCRPKTGKDVQPGSDTSYPATLYDSDHIAELDPSLRMCPAQLEDDQGVVEIPSCNKAAADEQVTADVTPSESSTLETGSKSPSLSVQAQPSVLWLAIGSALGSIIILSLAVVIYRVFYKPQGRDEDDSSLEAARGRGIMGFDESSTVIMRHDRTATVPSPPDPTRPSALLHHRDTQSTQDRGQFSMCPSIPSPAYPRPSYPELKLSVCQDLHVPAPRRPSNAPPPAPPDEGPSVEAEEVEAANPRRPSNHPPPPPPEEDSKAEAQKAPTICPVLQQSMRIQADSESETEPVAADYARASLGAPALAADMVSELTSHPLYRRHRLEDQGRE